MLLRKFARMPWLFIIIALFAAIGVIIAGAVDHILHGAPSSD